MTSALRDDGVVSPAELRAVLTDLARRYLDGVLQSHVVALRRLIIAEAERFPDLARTYFEQAPARAIEIIADALRTYAERGLLTAADPGLAAAHFAYLVLAIPQDRAQFYPGERPSAAQRDRLADEAVAHLPSRLRAPPGGVVRGGVVRGGAAGAPCPAGPAPAYHPPPFGAPFPYPS